jgi:homoserine dehydrogenase
MKKRMLIAGYGTVAKELVKLIQENSTKIKEQYGLEFEVTGIVGIGGRIRSTFALLARQGRIRV